MRRGYIVVRLFGGAVAIALAVTTAVGQVETSTSIRGLVTDSLGAAVPAAEVVITNTATSPRWPLSPGMV